MKTWVIAVLLLFFVAEDHDEKHRKWYGRYQFSMDPTGINETYEKHEDHHNAEQHAEKWRQHHRKA